MIRTINPDCGTWHRSSRQCAHTVLSLREFMRQPPHRLVRHVRAESRKPEQHLPAAREISFAGSMATGLLSLAAFALHHMETARILFELNLLIFVSLACVAAFALQQLYEPSQIEKRVKAVLSFIAAACILGAQFFLIEKANTPAVGLFAAGVIFWGGFVVSISNPFSKRDAEKVQPRLGAFWWFAVTATECLVVLGCLLTDQFTGYETSLLLACTMLWMLGCALYVWIATNALYHKTFKSTAVVGGSRKSSASQEFALSHWIDGGGMSLITLAGMLLWQHFDRSAIFQHFSNVIPAPAFILWLFATFVVVSATVLTVKELVCVRRAAIYRSAYWNVIVCIAAYACATRAIGGFVHIAAVRIIAQTTLGIGLLAWFCVATGLSASFIVRLIAVRNAQTRAGAISVD